MLFRFHRLGIAVSLRYESNLPFDDDTTSPTPAFTPEELRQSERKAEQLNTLCVGGRACFYLEKAANA